MTFKYEPCWACKKRNAKSNKKMYCPYCGAKKRQERQSMAQTFINLDLLPKEASFVGSSCFMSDDTDSEMYDIAKIINEQLVAQAPWIPTMSNREPKPKEVSNEE